MSIPQKKLSGLLPAPGVSMACDSTVFIEEIVGGAWVDVELQRGVYPGIQVTLQYSHGITCGMITAPLNGGHAWFLIPARAFGDGKIQIHYWIDGLYQKSEVLDLYVSTRL
ncbi:hypothetical protein ACIOYV_02230 [Pseudomonas sp. NPDC087342]|uniref:hypothetical protein n=1 Tax=Pseudomonas sp. NPDC087342 TaxID=3364437 RepID=UPI00381125D2